MIMFYLHILKLKLTTFTDWAGKMHPRFALPPQFISQMFFANITAVPVSSSTLPSFSSTNCPPRLHFDPDLAPYMTTSAVTTAITTATTIPAVTTSITAADTMNTIADITAAKCIVQDNEKRLADDQRTPVIS